MINVSNFTTCIPSNNQSCKTRPTFIYLSPDEYNQGFRYYSFMVKQLSTLDIPSDRKCVHVLMIEHVVTGVHEPKTLTKHISCECKCNLDGRKCNSDQK